VTVFKRQVAVFLTLFLAGCGAGNGGNPSLPTVPATNVVAAPLSVDVSGVAVDQLTPSTSPSPDASTDSSANRWRRSPATSTIFVGVTGEIVSSVSLYKAPFNGGAAASTICCDLNALVLDTKGDLFTLTGSNSLQEYAPPYTGSATSTPLLGFAPVVMEGELAVNPSGDVFVPDFQGNKVQGYASPYSSAPMKTITTSINEPAWLRFDGAGNLFVANGGNGNVMEYASSYTGAPMKRIRNLVNFTHGANFHAFAVDASDDIFVANAVGNTVTEYVPPYTGRSSRRTIKVGVNSPNGLVVDGNGYLFVVNSGNNTVTEYNPPSYATYQTVVTLSGGGQSFSGEIAVH
jgi:hypothetical protein